MDDMKNVFQLWLENDKRFPFKVRRWSWHPTTYFLVKEIKDVKWEYFEKTGKIYGKAYGDMYLRGELRNQNIQLDNAGSYQWQLIDNDKEPQISKHIVHTVQICVFCNKQIVPSQIVVAPFKDEWLEFCSTKCLENYRTNIND